LQTLQREYIHGEFFKTNAASKEEFIKTSEGIKYLRNNVE
jgi:hypothetical protein